MCRNRCQSLDFFTKFPNNCWISWRRIVGLAVELAEETIGEFQIIVELAEEEIGELAELAEETSWKTFVDNFLNKTK